MFINKLIAPALAAVCLFGTACNAGQEQTNRQWQDKKAAVSLSYDDALNVHLDLVVPALNAHGLRGTFYIPGSFAPLGERIEDWRNAAAQGHELGNHTLFHPCIGKGPGREWVEPDKDLSQWSYKRYTENLAANSVLLSAIDGKQQRSFAYPCGDMTVGGQNYIPFIENNFIGARAVSGEAATLSDVDLMQIPSYMVNGDSAEEMISKVDSALKHGGWLVFLFHGVGGEHDLNVDKKEHDKLLDYLQKRKQDVWVAPVVDVAKYVNTQKQ